MTNATDPSGLVERTTGSWNPQWEDLNAGWRFKEDGGYLITPSDTSIPGSPLQTLDVHECFEMTLSYRFASGYTQGKGKGQRFGFYANSGVRIWGVAEVQIFDTNSLLRDLKGQIRQDPKTGVISAPEWQNDDKNNRSANFISGALYGDTRKYDLEKDNHNKDWDYHKDETSPWNKMTIKFIPNQARDRAHLTVTVNGTQTFDDTQLVGGHLGRFQAVDAEDRKLELLSHWGSQVHIKDVKISDIKN